MRGLLRGMRTLLLNGGAGRLRRLRNVLRWLLHGLGRHKCCWIFAKTHHPRWMTMSDQADQKIEQPEDLARLRSFARDVMATWPRGDLEGGDLQDLAVKYGLLVPETRYAPCREECFCAGYATVEEFEAGVICYRRAALLVE